MGNYDLPTIGTIVLAATSAVGIASQVIEHYQSRPQQVYVLQDKTVVVKGDGQSHTYVFLPQADGNYIRSDLAKGQQGTQLEQRVQAALKSIPR